MPYKFNTFTKSFDYYNQSFSIPTNITTTGYVTGKKVGVFAYIDGPAITTITEAGVYQYIAGSFTNVFNEDFSLLPVPSIRYDGALTQYFEIHWYTSISANANGITVHVGINKNNELVTGSDMCTYCKQAGEQFFIAGVCATELKKDDEIQLVITCNSTGKIITINHFTTTIKEFFD